MNCKPNDLAAVIRRPTAIGCVQSALGAVVRVTAIQAPWDLYDSIVQAYDGPLWHLESPVSCKDCGRKLFMLPDSVLQPFDPDSIPDPAEGEAERPMLSGAEILTRAPAGVGQ